MAITRVAASARTRAVNLLRTIQAHPPSCPCHGNPMHPHNFAKAATGLINGSSRFMATPRDVSQEKDYAFEMAGV